MMKPIKIILICCLLISIMSSCTHNDNQLYQNFPIIVELETDYKVIDWSDLTPEERKQYPNRSFVIRTEEDFPEENLMNLEKLKANNIDFEKYSLLLVYNKIPGIIKGHRYTWRKNLQEGVFELFIDFTIEHAEASSPLDSNENDFSPDILDTDDLLTYYCSALLVNAIPADSKVEFWVSVQ